MRVLFARKGSRRILDESNLMVLLYCCSSIKTKKHYSRAVKYVYILEHTISCLTAYLFVRNSYLPEGLISDGRNKTINQARGLLFPVQ